MSQHYSDPSRESDAYTLPDVEVWQDYISVVHSKCGVFDVPRDTETDICPSCGTDTCVSSVHSTKDKGWFYWHCFPGCLPNSELYGPYATEREALDAARDEA